MGCASSAEEKEANSYGPVAGRQKQFIESVNPNYGAPAMDDSPKVALVCSLSLLCQYVAALSRPGAVAIFYVCFQRAQGSGVRRALLAGCNYPGNQYELHGCIRDVQQIQGVLQQNYGYEDVLLMVVRPDFSDHASGFAGNWSTALNTGGAAQDDGSTTSRPTGAVLKAC